MAPPTTHRRRNPKFHRGSPPDLPHRAIFSPNNRAVNGIRLTREEPLAKIVKMLEQLVGFVGKLHNGVHTVILMDATS